MISIEIVLVCDRSGNFMVFEVCIFFENWLMCGNCMIKMSVENFNVFCLFNYLVLVEVGIYIKYNNV